MLFVGGRSVLRKIVPDACRAVHSGRTQERGHSFSQYRLRYYVFSIWFGNAKNLVLQNLFFARALILLADRKVAIKLPKK